MEYLLVGEADKEGIFAYWGSRLKTEYLLIGEAD